MPQTGSPRTAPHGPPSKLLLWAEYRAVYELGLSLATAPILLTAPRGDGHPVLVLPGFLVSDLSTDPLRRFLSALGYDVRGWRLGRNLGGVYRMREPLRAMLRGIREETGKRVSLVGWSLGGIYARDLALALPDCVRGVITLGSPFTGDVAANNVGKLYDVVSGESAATALPEDLQALAGDMPVPATSIWSRTDGVVHWRSSQLRENARAQNIEVLGASHMGMGANPAVLWAIADRLAQPEGQFTHFRRGGPFALAYLPAAGNA